MSFFPLDPPAFEAPVRSAAPARTKVDARKVEAPPLDYALDSKGRWKGTDRIDQGVALSLFVELGSVASHPEVGHTLRQVEIGLPSTRADIEDRVTRSYPLSRYLEAGDVTTIAINFDELSSGGLIVSYEYRNNRTKKNARAFYRPNQG